MRGQVTGADFAAWFDAAPSAFVVLDRDRQVCYANQEYLRITGRSRDDLDGRRLSDVLPARPLATVQALESALERVLETGKPEPAVLERLEVPVVGRPAESEERWFSQTLAPARGPDGEVAWVIVQVEEATAFVRSREPSAPAGTQEQVTWARVYTRSLELRRLNEELRLAHERERQVAVTLQRAMLADPDLARHQNIAVRYLPAAASLNACGDWYDVVDVLPDRFAVTVGDVVGHGLPAAGVMGMLRSALSAAIRGAPSPAWALEVLGLYARSVDGALATTVVQLLIDTRSRLIIYSNAGHPPPVLLHPGGSYELLDKALDPPLGVRPTEVPRPQAGIDYTSGDTLVLYTDGLIERIGEDIGTGIARLTAALAEYGSLGAEELADALLVRLGAEEGARDDIALVIVRLL